MTMEKNDVKSFVKNSLFMFFLTQVVISVCQLLLSIFGVFSGFLANGSLQNIFLAVASIILKFIGCFILYNIRLRDIKQDKRTFFLSLLVCIIINFLLCLATHFWPLIAGDEFLVLGQRMSHVDEYVDVPLQNYIYLYPLTVVEIGVAGIFAWVVQKRKKNKLHEELKNDSKKF